MTKNIYAIGLKHHIQFREATKPPRKHVSTAVTVSKELEYSSSPGDCMCHSCMTGRASKIVSKDYTLVVTHYTGGKILCTVPHSKAYIHALEGEMVSLTNEEGKAILKLIECSR